MELGKSCEESASVQDVARALRFTSKGRLIASGLRYEESIALGLDQMYSLKEYDRDWRLHMPRPAVEDNNRLQIRVIPTHKARIARAAAILNTDLTQFVIQTALREADAVIERAESIAVSDHDFTRILDLLENPPAPNAKLKSAIAALPDTL